jgi:hypothetical protein
LRQPWREAARPLVMSAVSSVAPHPRRLAFGRHGDEAFDVVGMQLTTLQRLVELKPNAEDVALLKFWRKTAHAMLSIVAKPTGPHRLN